jgi:hypothetical protein
MSPNEGGGGSCGVSANEYRAQINFVDLTPYLTYDHYIKKCLPTPKSQPLEGGGLQTHTQMQQITQVFNLLDAYILTWFFINYVIF